MGKIFYLFLISSLPFICYSQTDGEDLRKGTDKAVQKDFPGSMDDLNRAIELNPNQALAYCVRGEDKFMLQDYAGAIVDFDKALMLNPGIEYAYCGRGLSEIRLNQIDKGCLDLNRAQALGNDRAGKLIASLCK